MKISQPLNVMNKDIQLERCVFIFAFHHPKRRPKMIRLIVALLLELFKTYEKQKVEKEGKKKENIIDGQTDKVSYVDMFNGHKKE